MPSPQFPTPDFTYDPRTDLRAGRRPYRKRSYRLEALAHGDKLLIHNYGHGGAGITMALGCAHAVRDLVRASGRAPEGTAVAVLGGGVMGFSAAMLLKDMKLNVRMYAKSFTKTVSDIAGGQWCPSLVERPSSGPGKQRFEAILKAAFDGYKNLINKGYGVSERPNFVHIQTKGFQKVPTSIINPVRIDSMPFEGHAHLSGWRYDTLLIEPPLYLGRLRRDLHAQHVRMIEKCFSSPTQIGELEEPIVVNCTGLGSGGIWPDDDLIPKQGQLIFLRTRPELQKYLYSGVPHGGGYIFPRGDVVVAGGSETDDNNDNVSAPMCKTIIDKHKDAFAGVRLSLWARFTFPKWITRDK